ncbi:hypothetical protein E1A91_D08G250400v1 [Gossypium mustelinum]|uniref:HMA domain-containing protein n=1 Tax=Gossypium mustelinum TaxID=34275 RepID=A0A5D2TZQ6_GOSMU|nr:hypothetical protein E1A91_D08G250400v1 [Gossypium mustelinum]
MATTEGKPETKQESKSAEPKQESNSKDVEEIQEPALKYKAWVLKVSIHCEGCKRKVEKILRKIDDHSANQNLGTCVYEVDADLKQQKVTVKANLHVNVDTLIKKIVKKGRHAELWPEKSEKKGKSKNKDKQGGQPNSEEGNHGDDKDKEAAKTEDGASKSGENGGDGCNGGQAPEPEKKGGGGESEGNAATGGGGGGSKKNKKKGQKGNATVNSDEGEQHHHHHPTDVGPPPTGSHFTGYGPYGPIPITTPMPSPANHSPPRHHHMDEYPTYYHAPPPVYVTSYNTAYPGSCHSESYYTSPRPYSYMYMHPGYMPEHPSFDTYSSYSSQPSDSFEVFSDENPNACSVM